MQRVTSLPFDRSFPFSLPRRLSSTSQPVELLVGPSSPKEVALPPGLPAAWRTTSDGRPLPCHRVRWLPEAALAEPSLACGVRLASDGALLYWAVREGSGRLVLHVVDPAAHYALVRSVVLQMGRSASVSDNARARGYLPAWFS